MNCRPIVGKLQAGLDHLADPSRAPVAAALMAAMVAQLVAPAFAWPAAGTDGAAAAADTSAQATAGSTPTPAPPPLTREDRHWMELVRACTANAMHVRLHFSGRTAEADHVETEAAGVRIRAPHLPSRSTAITEAYSGSDTLVAWSDVSKIEVRNVRSTGEGAAIGTVVGLAVGLPVAFAAAMVAALGSIFRAPIRMTHSSRTAKSQQIRMQAKERNA